jgi:hypothetical protein
MAIHRRTGQLTTEPAGSSPPGPGLTPPTAGDEAATRPQRPRWWAVAAWTGAVLILFAFFVRTALTLGVDSDGANNALQAWDMLHGNLLLQHWVIGDATYYTFDLPVFLITEVFFGLHSVAIHVASSITFLVVAVFAMALARTDSRGLATVARCCAAVAVMCAAFTVPGAYGTWIMLAKPDHVATGAFLLASFLLIDRAPKWGLTPLVLFVILTAGQVGDALVLYVAVPTVILVTLYRAIYQAIAARRVPWRERIPWRGLLIPAAAAISVPAAILIRKWMVEAGGYAMVPPHTQIAPGSLLGTNATLTWRGIQGLFGVLNTSGTPFGPVFGYAAMAAGLIGFGRVLWTWRRASAAEQMLCVAIVVNVCAYLFSTLPVSTNPREIAFLLPAAGVLAARALVPATIKATRRAAVAAGVAAAVALVPLVSGISRPVETPSQVPLVRWLEAHHLQYGIGGYWDASVVSVISSDKVQVRAVKPYRGRLAALYWETKRSWYNSSRYHATFVVAGVGAFSNSNMPASVFEHYLGKPYALYNVDGYQVLLYHYNVLLRVYPGVISANTGSSS